MLLMEKNYITPMRRPNIPALGLQQTPTKGKKERKTENNINYKIKKPKKTYDKKATRFTVRSLQSNKWK